MDNKFHELLIENRDGIEQVIDQVELSKIPGIIKRNCDMMAELARKNAENPLDEDEGEELARLMRETQKLYVRQGHLFGRHQSKS